MSDAGTRCLVPGCGNPYLAWHRLGPDEAVAMCLSHVEQAETAAVPAERLRALKRSSEQPPQPGRSRPAWQQRPLLVRVAGNFYYETADVFRLGPVTCIGFTRDGQDNLLLSLRMPTASGQPRARITENFWHTAPVGAELTCPSSGHLIDIAYPDGDHFRAELTDVHDGRALQVRYGNVARWAYRVRFPVTLAEITLTVANTDLAFGPDDTCMGGPTTKECFTSHGRGAIDIPMAYDRLVGLFP